MKAILLSIGVLLLLAFVVSAAMHNHAIRNGRCPRCGAPIMPFSNGQQTGYQCTECEWYEITDDSNTI